MVTYTRKVLDTSAANEDDGVFLKVVPLTADIADDFVPVRETNLRNLSESGVRLFRGHGVDLSTNTALLRSVEFAGFALDGVLDELESRGLALSSLVLPRSADELIDGRHCWVGKKRELTLGPLGSLARLVETRLLTFDDTGVASEESSTTKHCLQIHGSENERAGKSVADRFDLSGFAASGNADFEAGLILHRSELNWSEEYREEVTATDVLIESLSVDEGLTGFGEEADLGDGGLATAYSVEVLACGGHTREVQNYTEMVSGFWAS